MAIIAGCRQVSAAPACWSMHHLVDEDGGILGGGGDRGAGARVAAEHQAPPGLPRQRNTKGLRARKDRVKSFHQRATGTEHANTAGLDKRTLAQQDQA